MIRKTSFISTRTMVNIRFQSFGLYSFVFATDFPPPAPKPRSTAKTKPASTSTSKPRSTTKPASRATRAQTHGNQTLCDCSVPAIPAVVTDESASNGRSYWKCGSIPQSCNFFMFIHAVQSNVASSPAAPSLSRTSEPESTAASNEAPNCECGAAAGRRTVVKDGPNRGRPFWTCEGKSCIFFAWADEPLSSSKPLTSTIPTKRTFSNVGSLHNTEIFELMHYHVDFF
ncbi:hypothetical protein J3R30DRAFT_1841989 [Lentinula aciculospora]|uniref:GRF-type domain-containing protein n=1 Tax=Lentinula aciculospora TaxID=153920 RepID=A0A9W9AIX4_9AGAR|nr:hypothetical protein J3R30DRAFT_1841989 [Lentinula aciculospora]